MSSRNSIALRLKTGLLLSMLAGPYAFAQGSINLNFSFSPSPVGSGARAAGMADAFVAVADDATAASWNPAGLIQLELPEISIVGAYMTGRREYNADFHPETETSDSDSIGNLNHLSLVYPLPLGGLGINAVASLAYQQEYDFSRTMRLHFNSSSALVGPGLGIPINNFLDIDFEQSGGLGAISPALAFEITPRLSIGAAVNFWNDSFLNDNGWEQSIDQRQVTMFGVTPFLFSMNSREEYDSVSGENLTLGVLWSLSDKWSVGARYDSSFSADASYEMRSNALTMRLPSAIFPTPMLSFSPQSLRESRSLRFPDSLAVGVAYRHSDRLTVTADVTTTDWNDFYLTDGAGRRFSLVDDSNLDNRFTASHFDRTYTVRLGAEYVFIPKRPGQKLDHLWTLRGGLFYDEEPNAQAPDQFYGAALGVGYLWKQRVNIDAAYQVRTGNGVNSEIVQGIPGFDEDLTQHRFIVSTTVYF